jgi:hypothetical protein
MKRLCFVTSVLFFVTDIAAKSADSCLFTSQHKVNFLRKFQLYVHSPILYNTKLLPISRFISPWKRPAWFSIMDAPSRDLSGGGGLKSPRQTAICCTKLCHGFDKQETITESNHVEHKTLPLPGDKDRLVGIGIMLQNIFVAYLLFMTNIPSVSAVPESGRAIADSTPIVSGETKRDFANKEVIEEKVQIFQEILHDLDVSFVDPVDINKLAETGFNAMLNSLDPYTEFETPKAAKELRTQSSGNYGGVGLVVGRVLRGATESDVDPYPYVIKALEGFAFDAGIRVGVLPYPAHWAAAGPLTCCGGTGQDPQHRRTRRAWSGHSHRGRPAQGPVCTLSWHALDLPLPRCQVFWVSWEATADKRCHRGTGPRRP